MNRLNPSPPNAAKGKHYQIRIGQHLDPACSAWLGGLAIANLEGGEAILSGLLVDQSALYGILLSLHNLNVTLLEVRSDEQE